MFEWLLVKGKRRVCVSVVASCHASLSLTITPGSSWVPVTVNPESHITVIDDEDVIVNGLELGSRFCSEARCVGASIVYFRASYFIPSL